MPTEAALEREPRLTKPVKKSAIAVAVVVVLVGFAAWYWMFRANELSDYRPAQRGVAGLAFVGETKYATEIIGPDDNFWHDSTIDLLGVKPVIIENSAQATVRVLLCVPSNSGEGVSSSLSDFCRSAQPFQPGVVNLDQARHKIVLAVTLTQPGRLDIAGVQVTYRDGLRHGNQRSGIEWRWIVGR